MSEQKSHNPSGINWCVALLLSIVMLSVMFMPTLIVEKIIENEVSIVYTRYGNVPFLLLQSANIDAQNLSDFYNHLLAASRDWFQIDASSLEIPFIQSFDSWLVNRLWVVINALYLLAIRLGLVTEWGLICLPACLASIYYGIKQRESKRLAFTFTSPFQLALSIKLMKMLLWGILFAIFLPWTLPPDVLPSLLAITACFSGVLFSKLQKQI